MNRYLNNVTVTGEKATLTTLGAKVEISHILAKAPWRDLIEVLGDMLAGVIFSLVPAEDQEKVLKLTMDAIRARMKMIADEIAREKAEKNDNEEEGDEP